MAEYLVTVNGKAMRVNLLERKNARVAFEVEGARYDVEVAPAADYSKPSQAGFAAPSPAAKAPSKPQTSAKPGEIVAPMPGLISSVSVKVGDTVEAGKILLIMEAMKMENNIHAPMAGKVVSVKVKQGQEVQNGEVLVVIEP